MKELKDFTDSEEDEPVVEKPKVKKERSQKQIEALAKGRANALKNKEAKRLQKEGIKEPKVVEPKVVEKVIEKHYYHNDVAEPKKATKKKVAIETEPSDSEEEIQKPKRATPKKQPMPPPTPKKETFTMHFC